MAYLLLMLLLVPISSTISEHTVQWNSKKTTRIARPLVRKFLEPSTTRHGIRNQFFHYKTHFDIIIKHGTDYTLTIETSSEIDKLYFYCITNSIKGTFDIILNLEKKTNSMRNLTAYFDCVPMISASNNIAVTIKIESDNWIPLPIFDSDYATLATSHEVESVFYENVKIFGFVENYYTQMLLSANDIIDIKLSGYSLYVALQNQVEVVEYYDYLTNTDNFDITSSLDRSTLFILSRRIDYDNKHWISITDNIKNFLEPNNWNLLKRFARHYNWKETVDGLGETFSLWNDIFAFLYQHKYKIGNHSPSSMYEDHFDAVAHYHNGSSLAEWSNEEKFYLFVSIFGYDGTDALLREFRHRYSFATHCTDMIPTLLETFLDIQDINLLPFLQKVFIGKNFEKYNFPILSPDLEVRLLSGHSVMPAIDFNINPTQLRTRSEERDLRKFSPLMLVSKVKKLYLEVEFVITVSNNIGSSINLTGRCLYLNNKCHKIVGDLVKLELLSDVYSTYIMEEIDDTLYFSDIAYHTITKNELIEVRVTKIQQNKPFLPLVYYKFDAQGISDVFLQIFINYKNMTLAIKQLKDEIHYVYEKKVYFSLSLERNNSLIFKYEFLGSQKNKQSLINVVHEFRVGDKLNIFHAEPSRLKMNVAGYNKISPTNVLVFTNVGLNNDEMNFKFISADIKRIDNFVKTYSVDLSYNRLFQFYLARYIRALLSNGLAAYIPKHWYIVAFVVDLCTPLNLQQSCKDCISVIKLQQYCKNIGGFTTLF